MGAMMQLQESAHVHLDGTHKSLAEVMCTMLPLPLARGLIEAAEADAAAARRAKRNFIVGSRCVSGRCGLSGRCAGSDGRGRSSVDGQCCSSASAEVKSRITAIRHEARPDWGCERARERESKHAES